MATSGSISKRYGSVENVDAVMSWTRTNYSIENNTSTIYWELKMVSNGILPAEFLFDEDYAVMIEGREYSGTSGVSVGAGKTRVIASGTQTINHNTDGSKSFVYTFSLTRRNFVFDVISAGGIGELDNIPKPVSIVTAEDFTDEENPTITYSNVSDGVTAVEACISFTGNTDDVPYRAISKTGNSYTFNLTNEERATLRKGIASGNNRTVRFYLRTTIGSEVFWAYKTKTLTLVNYEPTLSPTVKDVNTSTAALTGDVNKIVRYYSNAQVTFGAVARKEATVAKKTAINGAQTINIEGASQDSVVINNVENNVFDLSMTDSRGYAVSKQVHFKGDNFIPYFKVTCNQTIRLTVNQTIEMTVKGNYYNGSFGAQSNALTIQTRHRESGNEWGAWENITPLISDISDNTYTLNTTISGYDPSGTYEFQCRAVDKLTTAESAIDTVTLKPIFDWSKDDFNFNVPLTIEGNPLDDFVIETGTEAMGTNGTWYWRKWKSGRAECYGCRNYGNISVQTPWATLNRSEAFSQDLPSGLFVATPESINITFEGSNNYTGWITRHGAGRASNSKTGTFVVLSLSSAVFQQVYIGFNVIGRWK